MAFWLLQHIGLAGYQRRDAARSSIPSSPQQTQRPSHHHHHHQQRNGQGRRRARGLCRTEEPSRYVLPPISAQQNTNPSPTPRSSSSSEPRHRTLLLLRLRPRHPLPSPRKHAQALPRPARLPHLGLLPVHVAQRQPLEQVRRRLLPARALRGGLQVACHQRAWGQTAECEYGD